MFFHRWFNFFLQPVCYELYQEDIRLKAPGRNCTERQTTLFSQRHLGRHRVCIGGKENLKTKQIPPLASYGPRLTSIPILERHWAQGEAH